MAGGVLCGCGGGGSGPSATWRAWRRPSTVTAVTLSGSGGVTGWRLAEHVVVLVGVLLLQLTCGHVLNKRYTDDGADMRLTRELLHDIHEEDDLQPYMKVVMQAVPVKYFAEKLKNANSYHDVLRIFYGNLLTNEFIDDMMTTQQETKVYGTVGRPRIGGLSDTMSFAVEQPSLEGISSPVMLDDAASLSNIHYSSPSSRMHAQEGMRHQRRGKEKKRRKGKKDKTRRKGRGKGRKTRKELQAATRHFKEMQEKARCSLPVPVVVRIRDISNAASKIYFPECTIIHHCRADAGCCNETSTCASRANSTITRSFYALEHVASGVIPSRKLVETFKFVNHTACECRPIPQIPKCLDCPHPFYLRRENKTDCSCDCFDRDHTCIRIKKGRRPLREDQLKLIKEGKCHRPKCQYGLFEQESIKTGYCPRSASHAQAQEEFQSGHEAGDTAKKRSKWG